MNRKSALFLGLFALVGGFIACDSKPVQKEPESNPEVNKADQDLLSMAQGLFKPLASRADHPDNPITAEKVELGKTLFHDTRLSKTGNNSCNSCHNLATFGVDNLPTSKGDAGKFGDRNSPTVFNAAIHAFQFWDGRAKDVEDQAGGPILNPVEMAIPSKEFLIKRLKAVPEYQNKFKAAFPGESDPLTYTNIQLAIAAFERTLMTPSAFDAYLQGEIKALNEEQRAGLNEFIQVGCIQCHSGAGLGGAMFQKFGVFGDYRTACNSKGNDVGKMALTKSEGDRDFFKVPSLRNVAMTHPYFHDGSVSDLKEAVKIMGQLQLNKKLSEEQVASIVSFLNTLTSDIPAEAKQIPAGLAAK